MSHNSLVDNALNNLRHRTSLRDSIRLFRTSSKDSVKSTRSSKESSSSYRPWSVYEQSMAPIILRDPEALKKLLEAIYDSPGGKRSLSRLARTCHAISEPALDVLWRDLDSIVPIIGLFPAQLLKKTRKPGLGLVRVPWSSSSHANHNIRVVHLVMKTGTRSSSIASVSRRSRMTKQLTMSPPQSSPFLMTIAQCSTSYLGSKS